MASTGSRHFVTYICRGRQKSLFLLLGLIAIGCFFIGRSSHGNSYNIGLFNTRQRDLTVQDYDGINGHGAAPVFPDPKHAKGLNPGRLSGLKGNTPRKIVKNISNVPRLTTKSVGYVSALNKTWMTWKEVDSPGVYRACVPRPSEDKMAEVVTGGLVEDKEDMTITNCLEMCNEMGFTYAALGRGTQCFCSEVKGNSSLLHYMNSAHCDIPCGGDKRYHCGGVQFMSLYRTRVQDSRCSNIELKSEGSLPLIALASFPRSGNTWTRQLIERATGIYTGSYFWKAERLQAFGSKSFLGGNVDYKLKQTICIKSHLSKTEHIKEFEGGAVILIRNPYSAIVAEVFRRFMFERNESPEAAMQYFKSEEWDEFAQAQASKWKEMASQWLQHSSRVLAIHYEDIQAHTFRELTKIVKFLNLEPETQRIMCATQEYPSSQSTGVSLGNHGSKTRVYLTYDPFSSKLRKTIDEHIRTVNESLAAHHQKVIPTDYSNQIF